MASLLKNTAGQNVPFGLVSATTGAGLTGATVIVYVALDNGTQAIGAGTITESGNGQYNYAPTQAETNATVIGLAFVATGAVFVSMTIWTDLPLPNVNAAAINSVSTSSVTTVSAVIGTPTAGALESEAVLIYNAVGALITTVGVAGAGLTAVVLAAAGLNNVLVAGTTLPNAIKYIGAAVAGKASGAGSGTETYDDFSGATAFVVVIDGSGNRTGLTYS